MVENKEKKSSTMNVDKTIEKQRLILDNLNEILKISPFVIDFIDKVSYQESLTKKFLGKTFFNGASSFLCSFASVCFALPCLKGTEREANGVLQNICQIPRVRCHWLTKIN